MSLKVPVWASSPKPYVTACKTPCKERKIQKKKKKEKKVGWFIVFSEFKQGSIIYLSLAIKRKGGEKNIW